MATYLVTGVAGFIASKVAEFLLVDGHSMVGVDNLNDAYDVRLKHWRLAQLEGKPGFEFHRLDICDRNSLSTEFAATRFRWSGGCFHERYDAELLMRQLTEMGV